MALAMQSLLNGGKATTTTTTKPATTTPTTTSKPQVVIDRAFEDMTNNYGTASTVPPVYYSKPQTQTQTVYTSSNTDDGSSARLQALRDQIAKSRDARLDALLKSLNLNINTYENELGNLDRNYQNLIDQSEVERYKTRNYIREALANRGQMDSGYGRQEAMNSDIKYGNTVNGIKAQREADRNTIRNAIASLKANYENDKANIIDQYANSELQLM